MWVNEWVGRKEEGIKRKEGSNVKQSVAGS